ncbi:MAG TPA: rod-binding protein [Dongiaceae bacterium]|jgi:hypothetical protein|nr:rod-binding protein [Dongiaceae bacterium]
MIGPIAALGPQTASTPLRMAALDFEAQFASLVIDELFAGIKPDALLGGGEGENIFRSLLIQEYGKALARQDSLGIEAAVQRELIAAQEEHRS